MGMLTTSDEEFRCVELYLKKQGLSASVSTLILWEEDSCDFYKEDSFFPKRERCFNIRF